MEKTRGHRAGRRERCSEERVRTGRLWLASGFIPAQPAPWGKHCAYFDSASSSGDGENGRDPPGGCGEG